MSMPGGEGALVELLVEQGRDAYLGEEISVLDHQLQTAALARRCGAPPALIVAALVHDVGWLLDPHAADSETASAGRTPGRSHAVTGAAWLRTWLPPSVSEPVRLHVTAKRWLCTTSASYLTRLSPSSRQSLQRQGGLLDAGRRRQFRTEPYSADAIRLRSWDDQAKDPAAERPALAEFLPLVRDLLARMPPAHHGPPQQ